MDKRIRKLIKISGKKNHRSLFVILGSRGFLEIPQIFQLLSAEKNGSEIIWFCSDIESTQRKIESQLKENYDENEDLVGLLRNIKYNSYGDSTNIARQCSLAVFQDFDLQSVEFLQFLPAALSSVKGGGAIVFVFSTSENIAQLQKEFIAGSARFSQRFLHFLCTNSVILDDSLNILEFNMKVSSKIMDEDSPSEIEKISSLLESTTTDPIAKTLIGLCKTCDQAQIVIKLMETLTKRKLHTSISVSSPLRRGKSATLGLIIAGSLQLNYSNIYLSSSSQEDLNTIFKFILIGLDALKYEEDKDYDLIQAVNPVLGNQLIGINVFKDHPQSVRLIMPHDLGSKIEQAELVVVDEAATLPLSILKQLTGPYVLLMASSVGLGATSPHLYNNLMKDLHPSLTPSAALALADSFQKETLNQGILYAAEDPVEILVNQVFCSNSCSSTLATGYPEPQQCGLFYVNQDIYISKVQSAEAYVQSLCCLLATKMLSPKYIVELINNPNIHIFALHSTSTAHQNLIICAIVVHIENNVPENIVHFGSNLKGNVTRCFNKWSSDKNVCSSHFIKTQGAHIVDFVTQPSYRRMGYGTRAFQLLQEFYEGKCISLEEPEIRTAGNENLHMGQKILCPLTEMQPDLTNYFTVSFDLASEAHRFWKKMGFVPVYSTKKVAEMEQVLFMMKGISESFESHLQKNWKTFMNYFCTLLNSEYRNMPSSLALNLLCSRICTENKKELSKEEIDILVKPSQMKSLEKFCQNLLDFHSIIHIIPSLTKLYFNGHFKDLTLPRLQEAILLSIGLQFKTVDEISKELGLPSAQIHGLLNRTIRKLTSYLNDIIAKNVEKSLSRNTNVVMEPIAQDLDEELEEAAKKIKEKESMDISILKDLDMSQYAIKGSEDDWGTALLTGRKTLVSIKSIKTSSSVEDNPMLHHNQKKHKIKTNKRKR